MGIIYNAYYLSGRDYLILLSRTILSYILEYHGGKHTRYKYIVREKQFYSQILSLLKDILASSPFKNNFQKFWC